MTKISQDGGGVGAGSMINNFYFGSLLCVQIMCNIELESVSAAVRTYNSLNKVHSFLEKDLLLILRTVSLLH